MKVFTRDYRIEHYNSPLWGEYFNGLKPCVLDIEATGLDPSRCKVVLMGLLTETESGLRVTQFLAENHYEEDRVLRATLEFLRDENIDYILTFNGLRYDVPFINTRLEKNFITLQNDYEGFASEVIPAKLSLYDFDLYRFLRKCTVLPEHLDSLSQASVEKYFGIASDRQDTISGRESVALFDEYSVTGNSTVEKIILTHNREDVLQLYKLMKIAGAEDFSELLKYSFHTAIAKYGFPVTGETGEKASAVRLSSRTVLNPAKKIIRITGDQIIRPFAAAYFPDIDSPITAMFNASSSSYEITVPVESRGDEFYADLEYLGISIAEDPDLVGRFLILNPRTINLLADKVVKKYL